MSASQNLKAPNPGGTQPTSLLRRNTRLRTQRHPSSHTRSTHHLQNLRVLIRHPPSLMTLRPLGPMALIHLIPTILTPKILLHHHCPLKRVLLLSPLQRLRSLFQILRSLFHLLLPLPDLTDLIPIIPPPHQYHLKN